MRRRYLVGYDIADSKRLRRVHKAMKGWGYPLQHSFFIADLSRGERFQMKEDLGELIHFSQDSVVIVDLGEVDRFDGSTLETMGLAKDIGSEGPWVL